MRVSNQSGSPEFLPGHPGQRGTSVAAGADQVGTATSSSTSIAARDNLLLPQPRVSSGHALELRAGLLSCCLVRRQYLQVVGQLADFRRRVAAVATKGLQERHLPSLAQRDTVLGDTCRMSATSA